MMKLSPIQERIDFILPLLKDFDADATIIDLGCGTGLLAKEIHEKTSRTIIGVDLDKENIKAAKKNCPKNKYYEADINSAKLPLADIIICSEVFEHLNDPAALLKKIRRKMKRRSILIITIPNGYGPWELVENQPLEVARNFVATRPRMKRRYYWLRGKLDIRAKDSVNSEEGSRHVQRFTRKEIMKLLHRERYRVTAFCNTHFVSCILPLRMLRTKITVVYKADKHLCRALPKPLSSGWGIVAMKK